jgi:hypothetical protein
MTSTKTSKRLSSRCHVEKYSQVRVLNVSKCGRIVNFISAQLQVSRVCVVFTVYIQNSEVVAYSKLVYFEANISPSKPQYYIKFSVFRVVLYDGRGGPLMTSDF